jgi:uncharacterized protein (DUF4415 family)
MTFEWDEDKRTSSKSQTDFARLDAMQDEDIDFSDLPEVTPEMFAKAVVRRGAKSHAKTLMTLRLDSDVLAWFKEQGRGYQTKMNALLRAYMEAHQTPPPRSKANGRRVG